MNRIAWCSLSLAIWPCQATTIVTLVTVHGIVVCADSWTAVDQSKNVSPIKPSSAQKQKLFVIQDRFAIAHDGNAALYFGRSDEKKVVPLATPYFAVDIINGLRRDVSTMATTAGVANLLREKLVSQFKGFDLILKSGAMTRDEGHPIEDDTITHYTVAGYDGPTAHVYEVGVGINWNTLTHHVAPVDMVHPGARKNISPLVSGYSDAIQDLWKNPNSPSTRKFASTFSLQYRALATDLDLSLDQMIVLARALLALQIDRTPAKVAYPLTVVTIPATGRITTQLYDK